MAAAGNLTNCIDNQLGELPDRQIADALKQALSERHNIYGDTSTTLFFQGQGHNHMAAYLQIERTLDELDKQLLEVFCSNIVITLDNVLLLSQLKDHAYNDQLLHIPNRLALIHALDRALASSVAGELTLALIDIDGFSEFNDTLGHKLGDAMLQAMSTRLQDALPSSSLLARVDGDVFGILAEHSTLCPQQLQTLLHDPLEFADLTQRITATIGLVRLDHVDGKGSDALKAASIALKHGKQQERGSISNFSHQMEFETRARVQLLQDLRLAFEHERLFVVYQPQFNLQNDQLVGVEALLRWRTEDNRFVSPAEFIPLAESSGLIVALGEWVLRMACHDLGTINQHSQRPLRMAINVSVAQLRHPGFIDMLSGVLTESNVQPHLVELEITESMAMLDADLMTVLIDQIKAQGLSLAIDDFGTGFSSLSYLERLNVDRLKIDLSFIRQLEQSEGGRRIVETIIQLGQSLDLEVIAEGIEQQSQAALLKQMGCHEGQGYLFAKPLPMHDLLAFIAAHSSE